MKRIITIIIIISLLIIPLALADSPDYSSLSFEELQNLKNAVDLEYNSRPESEGIELKEGVYIVGIDILPGNYYATMIKPDPHDEYSLISVYEDEKTYSVEKRLGGSNLAQISKSFNIGEEPMLIPLHEDNCVYISLGSVFFKASKFDPKDYYTYNTPEGVFVPSGVYHVPEDIPAGKYTVYPATTVGGAYSHHYTRVKDNGESFSGITPEALYVFNEIESETINLLDGDRLDVSKSIILSTTPKLDFN